MPPAVVTVTEPATATATPTGSANSSSLSPEATAGIIIGTLLGAVLLLLLVLFLRRYREHKFMRVANPAYEAAGADYVPGVTSRRSKRLSRHSQKPSISSEPLIPPTFPSISSRGRLSDTPPRLGPISPISGDSPHSSFDIGEIDQVIASGTISRAFMLDPQPSPVSSHKGVSPPHSRQTSGDDVPSTPTKSLFLHRMVKSRAQASEDVAAPRHISLDVSESRSTTLNSAEEERLLAEAESTALRDVQTTRGKEEEMESSDEDAESADSIYSQPSASVDHSGFFSQNSTSTLPRRKSSRKQRTPGPAAGLSPVVEIPDTPKVSRSVSSLAGSMSLDAQASHRTASPPMPSGTAFPLLTSVNFGNDNTSSGTRSIKVSSASAQGSSSNGGASRYPSLAASSILSGRRSDGDTEWLHPLSGLAGLSSLQSGPLHNPHSPVEERPAVPDVLTPANRARLREGSRCSIPEVERRAVMQGGIAHIDVTF